MTDSDSNNMPLILAPAGNNRSFLAAIAAGADAVYCGLKLFSARMEAKNFTVETLRPLAELARGKRIELYIALNSLIKPDELAVAGRLLRRLEEEIKPTALIIQDLALAALAQDAGFSGELHLSTLANFSFSRGFSSLPEASKITRVVLPRELTVDEIKRLAAACPPHIGLETFVHGALCFGVSGRCYWSSYLGGKSGLRGRCVQPCRRLYHKNDQRERFFSCKDLSLDVLVKVLKSIPQIRAWKIEGRKKGPHYVYYTVRAYQLLRDHGGDPAAKRDALNLLEQSLGRPGTHYYFLSQRPQSRVDTNEQTCSGRFIGRLKGSGRSATLSPYQALLPGDSLRIGDEDHALHAVIRVNRFVPAKGSLFITLTQSSASPKGTPVYLTDRCEPELEKMISSLELSLVETPTSNIESGDFVLRRIKPSERLISASPESMKVIRTNPPPGAGKSIGVWLAETELPPPPIHQEKNIWWWLPPVIWPEAEDRLKSRIDQLSAAGHRRFVLNAPWQTGLFENPRKFALWAGPFCNVANPLAVEALQSMGMSGIIISPELGQADALSLPAAVSLPLGIVTQGLWPLCISRIRAEIPTLETVYQSPKHETAWTVIHGQNLWVYPDWIIDLTDQQAALQRAGYRLFVNIEEILPRGLSLRKRPGNWNWDLSLL